MKTNLKSGDFGTVPLRREVWLHSYNSYKKKTENSEFVGIMKKD